ncbi:MAG: ERF family protein, partial [Bdellovibrionales bacterium]|nr:ERF family protein [Bdellovibrionales bacterium]
MSEIDKALLEAQRSSTGLKKDGTNSFGKFNYVSIEEVVTTARQLLHDQSLVFYPSEQVVHVVEEGEAWIKQTYLLLHVPSGESKEIK